MGFQVRKRTKGKSGWWNGSYSRRGVGASGSVKVGENVTWNTGDLINGKINQRVTVNLGNGMRWVWYGKKKSAKKQTAARSEPSYTKPWNSSDTMWFVWSFIGVSVAASVFGFWGFALGVTASFLWMFIKVNWYE